MLPETVHKFFLKHFPDQSVEDIFAPDTDYDAGKKIGAEFFQKSGLHSLPKVLLNGVVLDDALLQADKIEETILMQVMRQTPNLQRAVLSGKLTDKENVQVLGYNLIEALSINSCSRTGSYRSQTCCQGSMTVCDESLRHISLSLMSTVRGNVEFPPYSACYQYYIRKFSV